MKQVKIFNIPEEVPLANEFLAKNPPESVATVSKGDQCFILVHFDDYTFPDGYQVAEIREYMLSNTKTKINTAVARVVAQRDLGEFDARLKVAEGDLSALEAEEAPADKKAKFDFQKAQGEKILKKKQEITEITNSINNIKAGIEKSLDSDKISDCKNEELQRMLDKLTQK